MNRNPDEETARERLYMLTAVRMAGILLMIAGLVIWRTDLVLDGGWPVVGGLLFAVGFLESLLLPKFFARRWRSPPGP